MKGWLRRAERHLNPTRPASATSSRRCSRSWPASGRHVNENLAQNFAHTEVQWAEARCFYKLHRIRGASPSTPHPRQQRKGQVPQRHRGHALRQKLCGSVVALISLRDEPQGGVCRRRSTFIAVPHRSSRAEGAASMASRLVCWGSKARKKPRVRESPRNSHS